MKWRWREVVTRLTGRKGPETPPPELSPPLEADPAPRPETTSSEPMAMDNAQQGTSSETRRSHGHGRVDAAARVYAQALVEMADESGRLDETTAEVRDLAELLRTQPELAKLIAAPTIGVAEKGGSLERLFKGRLSDTTYKFLRVVNAKGRLAELANILAGYEELIAQRRGIVEVDVYVAQRMDAGEAEKVAQRIGAALKKEVVLHQYVNPDLIGGLVIRVGDQLIDGSVATQLKNLRTKLIEAGRNRARNQTL